MIPSFLVAPCRIPAPQVRRATWNAGPQGVMVWSTTPAYIVVGEDATATTASTPIPAFTPIPFIVPQGSGGQWRVSAIRVSEDGAIFCRPVNIR
jgi:hypothetical protein